MLESIPVKELCRKQGFSEGSYYFWRSTFGGMTALGRKSMEYKSSLALSTKRS